MNRHQLAHLIAQTQPTMNSNSTRSDAHSASAQAANKPCNQSQPLSPRQKFQSHIRTLSQESAAYSKNASVTPYSPSLSSSPSPTIHTYRYRDSTVLEGRYTQNEPQFITEEREAWARPSPSSTRRGRNPASEEAFVLQPPRDQSPAQQPRKHLRELRPFAPSAPSIDVNERPKTSRGSKVNFGQGQTPTEDQDLQSRNSRFAEGSMTARSAGISSTWPDDGSISTISGEDSDGGSTPRASPQHSTADLDDLKAGAVTPGTFKQRLARIGSAFKSAHHSSKPEADTQDAKKRKGLRKSMSLWNLHNISGKSKTGGAQSILDLSSVAADPQKATADHDLEVLNDRKRRAELAYTEQFGAKKRKSNVGVAEPTAGPRQDQPSRPRDDRTSTRRSMRPSVSTRRLSHSSSTVALTDMEVCDAQRDIDSHKRPSRRELEKENQQLRAMLRQQETQSLKTPRPAIAKARSSSATRTVAPSDSSPPKQETKTPPKTKTTKSKTQDIPPVPSVPDRIALQPLSNARNQSRSTSVSNNANINNGRVDLKPTAGTNNNNTTKSNTPDNNNPTKRMSTNGGSGHAPLPRPVSMILEEDEDGVENRTPGGKSTLTMDDIAKFKQLTPSPVRLHPGKREPWEWPDDIF